ncbi:MAG TPA: M14 family metallopeptidase [Anaerolineae bacterium]|nr:M14 family metallopeptidase [Anaerolineae bacterium]
MSQAPSPTNSDSPSSILSGGSQTLSMPTGTPTGITLPHEALFPQEASTGAAMMTATPASSATALSTSASSLGASPSTVSPPTPTPTAAQDLTAPPATAIPVAPNRSVFVGNSYSGRAITARQFGHGPVHIILVGGIHGGYEWNTVLLAYEAIDFFSTHPSAIPSENTLTIIPNANPDGLFAVTNKEGRFNEADLLPDTVPGRFNGRGVDLNRNWDCQWQEEARWQDRSVSGGSYPFSEPESRALRDFFLANDPALVLFWHSAANGVFAAGCPDIFQPSYEQAEVYGRAAGYPTYERFDAYSITGGAAGWLALQGIPSISVELKTHEEVEWEQNLAGIEALLATNHQPSP